MTRIVIAIQLLCAAFLFVTCERSNMFNLAMYGLPPRAAIYIYSISAKTGALGSRNNIDNECSAQGIAYIKLLKTTTAKAFLSFSAIDEIRFLVPVQYWYYPVIAIAPSLVSTTISNTWLGLWDGTPYNPINSAVGIPTSTWWSGSNADGSTAVNDTCSEWQKSDLLSTGRIGDTIVSSAVASPFCDTSQYVLCITY